MFGTVSAGAIDDPPDHLHNASAEIRAAASAPNAARRRSTAGAQDASVAFLAIDITHAAHQAQCHVIVDEIGLGALCFGVGRRRGQLPDEGG